MNYLKSYKIDECQQVQRPINWAGKKHYFTQNKMYFDNYKNLKSYKSTSGQNSIIVFAKLF